MQLLIYVQQSEHVHHRKVGRKKGCTHNHKTRGEVAAVDCSRSHTLTLRIAYFCFMCHDADHRSSVIGL